MKYFDSQKELFNHIWMKHQPYPCSFVSGESIRTPRADNFAHVLGKGAYPKIKLLESNIVLLTSEEHRLYDHDDHEHRMIYAQKVGANWKKLYDLAEELKEYYRSLSRPTGEFGYPK